MFNKNDPLIASVKKVMEQNEKERQAVKAVNEKFGIQNRKALPHQQQGAWDAEFKKVLSEEVNLDESQADSIKKYMNKRGRNASGVPKPAGQTIAQHTPAATATRMGNSVTPPIPSDQNLDKAKLGTTAIQRVNAGAAAAKANPTSSVKYTSASADSQRASSTTGQNGSAPTKPAIHNTSTSTSAMAAPASRSAAPRQDAPVVSRPRLQSRFERDGGSVGPQRNVHENEQLDELTAKSKLPDIAKHYDRLKGNKKLPKKDRDIAGEKASRARTMDSQEHENQMARDAKMRAGHYKNTAKYFKVRAQIRKENP